MDADLWRERGGDASVAGANRLSIDHYDLRPGRGSDVGSPIPADRTRATGARIYSVAAVCALIFAIGLPSVEIIRQARMYSMMLAWILVQVIFLLRTRRLGGLANYVGLTVFSAIALATNFPQHR